MSNDTQVAALPDWEHPLVQAAYKILCSDDKPPEGEHWEGFVARRITAAAIALQAEQIGPTKAALDAEYAKGRADGWDAARYRWLRDEHIGDDPESINLAKAKTRGLDAAIDAAIRATKGGEI